MDGLLQQLSNPRLLKLAWKFNVQDIAQTLRTATQRVLDDAGGNAVLRERRAQALNLLGHAFYKGSCVRGAHQQPRNQNTAPNAPGESEAKGREGETFASTNSHYRETIEFPDVQTIQEAVRIALLESVVQEGVLE